MSSNPASFGEILRQFRMSASLTQEELSERAGLSLRGISDLERGARRTPHLTTVRILADTLQLSPPDRQSLFAAARPEKLTDSDADAPFSHVPLPVPLTSLIGREQELSELVALLGQASVRLVTLTGPGGSGKTRLALDLATQLRGTFSGGVTFVDLTPLRDAQFVLPTIASLLGVRERFGQPLLDTLSRFLAEQQLLLLLDNFEQVLEAAPNIAALLAACPRLSVLATSRAALRVRGEREVPLLPLPLPVEDQFPAVGALAQVPAVALFVERAQAADPSFTLREENATTVAAICRRLDGLPLAIELAAAWIDVLPPAALLGRLEQRLLLLSGGRRDLPARQRALRDAIDWSYALLTPEAQSLFRRLAVFVGGFTVKAAEAVGECDSIRVLQGLAELVNQSLVQRVEGSEGEPRFGMLETIREFGLAEVVSSGEEPRVQASHAAYFLALAEAMELELRGGNQVAAVARLDLEQGNLRQALVWSLALPSGGETAIRLAAALHMYWHFRGRFREGREWLEQALAHAAGGPTPARIRALVGLARLAVRHADFAAARAAVEEGIAIGRSMGDASGVAYGLFVMASGIAYPQGDYAFARECAEESLALYRSADDPWGIAAALWASGLAAFLLGDPNAGPMIEECLHRFRAIGDAWGIAAACNTAGVVAVSSGDDESAAALYEECIDQAWRLEIRSAVAIALHNLAYVEQRRGALKRAESRLAEALSLQHDLGDRSEMGACMMGLAGFAALLGHPRRAARLAGAGERLIDDSGEVLEPLTREACERNLGIARADLGEATFAEIWAAGYRLPVATAIAEARALPTEATGETDGTITD